MDIQYFRDYQQLSVTAADWLTERIRRKPKLKLGIATGNSPLEMYRNIAKRKDLDKTKVSLFQIDEWAGITDYSNTCRAYIEKEICKTWGIHSKNFHSFIKTSSQILKVTEVQDAADFMQHILDEKGPLDVLILGFGKNGHIGFIEPSNTWAPDNCFVSTLDAITQKHDMIESESVPSNIGVTMGIKTIMEAKEILFIITGDQKENSYAKWLTKERSPQIPASILWQHEHVMVLTDLMNN